MIQPDRVGTGLLLAGLFWPLLLFAYPDGAPPGHTGAPGEESCSACHYGGPGVGDDAGLRLSSFPTVYRPGETYRFSLLLDDPEASVAGFQLRAVHLAGRWRGAAAGQLSAGESGWLQVQSAEGIQYLGHAEPVTRSGDAFTWTVEWQAPDEAHGSVAFFISAVAANGDDSSLGDNVYRLRQRLEVEN